VAGVIRGKRHGAQNQSVARGNSSPEREKIQWYLASELRDRIRDAKLAVTVVDKLARFFCHAAGGELEQIQSLLGHVSVQTTERYLGCKQRINGAANDGIEIE
jgi:hypothetical protein